MIDKFIKVISIYSILLFFNAFTVFKNKYDFIYFSCSIIFSLFVLITLKVDKVFFFKFKTAYHRIKMKFLIMGEEYEQKDKFGIDERYLLYMNTHRKWLQKGASFIVFLFPFFIAEISLVMRSFTTLISLTIINASYYKQLKIPFVLFLLYQIFVQKVVLSFSFVVGIVSLLLASIVIESYEEEEYSARKVVAKNLDQLFIFFTILFTSLFLFGDLRIEGVDLNQKSTEIVKSLSEKLNSENKDRVRNAAKIRIGKLENELERLESIDLAKVDPSQVVNVLKQVEKLEEEIIAVSKIVDSMDLDIEFDPVTDRGSQGVQASLTKETNAILKAKDHLKNTDQLIKNSQSFTRRLNDQFSSKKASKSIKDSFNKIEQMSNTMNESSLENKELAKKIKGVKEGETKLDAQILKDLESLMNKEVSEVVEEDLKRININQDKNQKIVEEEVDKKIFDPKENYERLKMYFLRYAPVLVIGLLFFLIYTVFKKGKISRTIDEEVILTEELKSELRNLLKIKGKDYREDVILTFRPLFHFFDKNFILDICAPPPGKLDKHLQDIYTNRGDDLIYLVEIFSDAMYREGEVNKRDWKKYRKCLKSVINYLL